jgi:hypothetical protein
MVSALEHSQSNERPDLFWLVHFHPHRHTTSSVEGHQYGQLGPTGLVLLTLHRGEREATIDL